MGRKLINDFYLRKDVIVIAKELLGKLLVTRVDGQITSGIIVETEAYRSDDRASHAFQKKKTRRNSIMFHEGGVAYVFINYGIHYLFNIVTNLNDEPDAILIRGLQPVTGLDIMMNRRNKSTHSRITSGPGALSKAMGIDLRMNGESLQGDKVWIDDENSIKITNQNIVRSRRIGIDYAGEHSLLPWRFYIKRNPWISKP